MQHWTGVFPAVTTKLTSDGQIDLEAFSRSIERLIDGGVSGIIVLPMLGENACMRLDEKEMLIRTAKRVVAGRVSVLSGLAEISLDDAVSAAKRYQEFGAEGLMVFPSLGYRTDHRETVNWYTGVGRATDLPIMIYNNPLAYKVDVTPEILLELREVETIQYVKEETGDTRRITDIFNMVGDRFGIFCGIDDLILESLALGATGWVSGMTNAWPKECVQLFNLAFAGRYDEALLLYRILTPAFHLDTHVKLVQYIKFAEHLVYGAPEWVRAPRLPLAGDERRTTEAIISRTISALALR